MFHEVFIQTSSGRRSIIIDDDYLNSLSQPISQENRETVSLFIASWCALLADSPISTRPLRVYHQFLKRISDVGIKNTVLGYSDLCHKLVAQHHNFGTDSSIGDWIPEFKDTPVFFEYHRYYNTGDPNILSYLYTFLNFGKKLEFVDESFNATALRSWLDIEKKLNDIEYDPDDVSQLRAIIGSLLEPFSFTDFRPKFGPGSVQERGVRGRIDKLSSLQFDPLINRFLFHGHIGKYGLGEDLGIDIKKVIPNWYQWQEASDPSSRIARIRFVPKNLKVSRSICMEPNTLMFFQQAVLREIRRAIRKSDFNRFIRFEDQTRNQRLAFEGSYTSECDTIDLSAASDSVSLKLVKSIFPPSWLIPMITTRSHSVYLPDNTIVRLNKFAPMGSALCFPTQSIIFASVCIMAAIRRVYEKEKAVIPICDWIPQNISRVVRLFKDECSYDRKRFQPLAVYGDDICVDSSLTQDVVSILSRLGFEINISKSFTDSQAFRESCGKYYLSGTDITPLYFRIEGVRSRLTASHVVSGVHLINESYLRRYKHLYRFLHNSIMHWRSRQNFDKNPIAYVTPNSSDFGIFSATPVNKHVSRRYNRDLQYDEFRVWTISYDYSRSAGTKTSLVDHYEYMRWWTSRSEIDTSGDSKPVSRSDRGGAALFWRWMPDRN